MNVIAWLAFAYIVMSLLEYSSHRWLMHSRALARRLGLRLLEDVFESHATLHHGRFFAPRQFASCSDPAARYVSVDLGAVYMLTNTVWLWAPLALFSIRGAVVVAIFIAAHGMCWSAAHREMHFPAGRWFARTTLFRFWRAWHEVHHDQPSKNFNVLLPLFDFIFGTH